MRRHIYIEYDGAPLSSSELSTGEPGNIFDMRFAVASRFRYLGKCPRKVESIGSESVEMKTKRGEHGVPGTR